MFPALFDFQLKIEKLNAFIESLTDEQKSLYEAAMPSHTQFFEGEKQEKFEKTDRFERLENLEELEKPEKPDEEAITAMKEKQEAFIASLSESQKTAYDELFEKKERPSEELTDTQKAEMEATRGQFKRGAPPAKSEE